METKTGKVRRERSEWGPKWANSVEVTKLDNGQIKITWREKDRQVEESKP